MSDFFNNFYEIVERQIRTGNVLVHCSAGVSRVSLWVYEGSDFGYLVSHEKIELDVQGSY